MPQIPTYIASLGPQNLRLAYLTLYRPLEISLIHYLDQTYRSTKATAFLVSPIRSSARALPKSTMYATSSVASLSIFSVGSVRFIVSRNVV